MSNGVGKVAVLAHVGTVAAAVYYVTRVHNFTPLSELPSKDMAVFAAAAAPPLVAWAIGRSLARGARAARVLAYGLAAGATVYVLSFLVVLTAGEAEPLAPLWLIVVSLWLVPVYAILLLLVWLAGRRADA